VDAAKRLLADSGYAGEPVTLMAPKEVPALKAWGDVIVALIISRDDLDETSAIEVARKPCYAAQPAAMSVAGP